MAKRKTTKRKTSTRKKTTRKKTTKKRTTKKKTTRKTTKRKVTKKRVTKRKITRKKVTKKKTVRKKVTKKRVTKRKTTKRASVASKPTSRTLVGSVVHFFDKISVAVVDIKRPLNVGDKILVEGPQTNFKQTIKSMQVEHSTVKTAKRGDNIGLKTSKPVRARDLVYRV